MYDIIKTLKEMAQCLVGACERRHEKVQALVTSYVLFTSLNLHKLSYLKFVLYKILKIVNLVNMRAN